MRISITSLRALAVVLCCASTALAAPGTPFYSTGPGRPWGYSGYSHGGTLLSDGIHFSLPSEDALSWGVVGAAAWEPEPRGASNGTVQDLRVGASGERVRAFDTVQIAIAPNSQLLLTHVGDELKSEVQLVGTDRAAFFWSGARSVELSERGDELTATFQGGSVKETGLRCWQPLAGGDVGIDCRFTAVREVSERRFEYAIATTPVDPSAPVIIDPTFVWSIQAGGTLREDYPRVAAANAFNPLSHWEYFAAGTFSPSADLPTGPRLGNPADNSTSNVLVGFRDELITPNSWSYAVLGGNRTDSPRDIVETTTGDWCTLGVTSSDLPSLAVLANSPALVGPVNDGGTSNGFIFCWANGVTVSERFIVFGGSGQDEPQAFVGTVGPYAFAISGWTRSNDFCTGCGTTSAGGTGFAGRIDATPPTTTTSLFAALYPPDGGQGQLTDVAWFHNQVYALAAVNPSPVDHRLEFLELNPVTYGASVRASLSGSFDTFFPPLLVNSGGGMFVIGNADGGIAGANTALNAPHVDAGFPQTDGFVVRLLPQDGGAASVPWVRYVGGESVDCLLGGAATVDEDLVVGGYTYSSASGLGVTFGGLPTVVGSGSRMLLADVSKDGTLRWVNVLGGPNGQDQAVSLAAIPDAGANVRSLFLAGFLDGSNDGGSYPAVQAPWYTDRDRQIGLFGFQLDITPPSAWIDAGDPVQMAPASFRYGASYAGTTGYLRELIPTLIGPDGGELPVAAPDVRGSVNAGPYTATSPDLTPGQYTLKVRAVTRDGYDAFAVATVIATPFDGGEVDAGPGEDAGQEQPGTDGSTEQPGFDAGTSSRTQRSPGGCSCDSSAIGIPMIALTLAIAMKGRRRSRNSAE